MYPAYRLCSLSPLPLLIALALSLLALGNASAREPAARTGIESPAARSVPREGTLCHSDEAVVFSCVIAHSGKRLSLCSSKELDDKHDYLQYRFGRPGKVELEFPKDRRETQSAFRYTRYTRPLVTYLTLEFQTGGYLYSLSQDDNADEHPPVETASITVTPLAGPQPEQKSVEIQCRTPFTGTLMFLEDVVPRCDEESSNAAGTTCP